MRQLFGLLIFVICGLPATAFAQTGFYLPSSPISYGQDEFRAADGTTCRSSMDGTKRVELGTYASAGQNPVYGGYSYPYSGYYNTPMQGNAGVYGRFTMSLDANPDRIDCKKLFDLEMEKKKLEVELLKRSLISADRQLDDLKDQRRAGGSAADGRQKESPRDAASKTAAVVSDERPAASGKGSRTKDAVRKRDMAPL